MFHFMAEVSMKISCIVWRGRKQECDPTVKKKQFRAPSDNIVRSESQGRHFISMQKAGRLVV